jgi:hypothetical protein
MMFIGNGGTFSGRIKKCDYNKEWNIEQESTAI